MSHFVSECWQLIVDMPFPILASIAVWAVVYLLNMLSFALVLPAVRQEDGVCHVPRINLLRVTVAGYAFNYITPFGLLGGEPYRVWYLKRYMPSSQAAWSVGLYASMHVASHFVFWIIALIFWMDMFFNVVSFLPFILALIAVGCVTAWLSYKRHIGLYTTIRSLFVEFLSRVVGVLEYWMLMHAAGLNEATFFDAYLVVAISSLVANILFFSPMQAGTREAGITLALALLYGGGAEAAVQPEYIVLGVTISLATRIRELVWIAVGFAIAKRPGT